MKRLLATLVILGLLFAGFVVFLPGQATAQTTRHGGWADSIVWSLQGDGSQATAAMDTGALNMWLYYYNTPQLLTAAQNDPNIGLLTVAGSTEDMLFNPASTNVTASATIFNPFAVRAVRTAMNYLVDRSYIAREIYGGAAFPMTAVESSQTPEFARDPVYFASLEAKYPYSPSRASSMVTDAMSRVTDVTFASGKWNYKGTPIVIKLLARVEDQRHQIGDYLKTQLESVGFTVDEQVVNRATAVNVVYNGDPTGGAWMAYTEGFATTALTAWPDSDPYYFYCGGNGEPFWSVNGGTYAPPAELNDACNRLLAGQYTSVATRQSLFETAADMGIQDSVRMWLAAGATFPYSKKTIAPFVYDLAGATWSMFSTRNTRLLNPSTGQPITGGTLNIGNRVQFVSPWVPWGPSGFSFLYDVLPYYDFTDPGVFPDPHTGLYIPIRAAFDVTTQGPTGNMAVPSTAYWFDAGSNGLGGWNNTWRTVGSGKTATSKVIFTYTFGPWHNGIQMDMSDVLYATSLIMRRVGGDIFAKDQLAAQFAAQLFAQTFKGLEVIDSTHLAIYLNYWHVDPTVIASTADVFPSTSWDESELAMATVLHNNAKVDLTTANANGMPALDLTKGAPIGLMDAELAANITTSGATATVPPGFGTGSPFAISSTDATARWAAVAAYKTASGTYYSSNGPYFIYRIDTTANTIEFHNFGGYPYLADHWDSLVVPKVPSVTVTGPSQVITGLSYQFNMTTSFGGTAYDKVSSSWILLDPASNSVISSGTPTRTGAGTWAIGVSTAQLTPGAYTLETITVGDEAAVPVFKTVSFTAISQAAYIEGITRLLLEAQNSTIKGLRDTLNQTNVQLATAQSSINSLTGLLYASIVVAVVAVVVAVASIALLTRRLPKSRGGGGGGAESERGPEEL